MADKNEHIDKLCTIISDTITKGKRGTIISYSKGTYEIDFDNGFSGWYKRKEFEIYGVDDVKNKEWSKKIAKADGRPSHPEDYEEMAKLLLSQKNHVVLFNRIITLRDTPSCHTADMFSFHDFWRLVLRF